MRGEKRILRTTEVMTVRKKTFGLMMAASGGKMSAASRVLNVMKVWRSFEIFFGIDLGRTPQKEIAIREKHSTNRYLHRQQSVHGAFSDGGVNILTSRNIRNVMF